MGVSIIKGKTSAGASETILTDTDGAIILNPANVTSMSPPAITQTKSLPFLPYASLQRPANGNAYTVGDVWGTASDSTLTFSVCAPANGGGGTIVGVTIGGSTAGATDKVFNLYLFNAIPSAAIADHAVFTLDFADFSGGKFVGKILGISLAQANASDTSSHATVEAKLPFKCATGSTALYGRAVVAGTYTPGSGEVVGVQLHILP